MPRRSKKTVKEASPKRRGKRSGSPCRCLNSPQPVFLPPPCCRDVGYSPQPVFRPPPCLREAGYSPRGCVSYRAIRGYRPGDYFTRGISLGGDARIGTLACAVSNINAAEGYATWRPKSCADVPKITACSRLWGLKGTEASAKEKKARDASSSSSSEEEEEEEQRPVQKAPEPQKCVCTSWVEAKKFTNDAFTMTEVRARDQGTVVDLATFNKAVDATLVTRDVATDTDDDFEAEMRATLKNTDSKQSKLYRAESSDGGERRSVAFSSLLELR